MARYKPWGVQAMGGRSRFKLSHSNFIYKRGRGSSKWPPLCVVLFYNRGLAMNNIETKAIQFHFKDYKWFLKINTPTKEHLLKTSNSRVLQPSSHQAHLLLTIPPKSIRCMEQQKWGLVNSSIGVCALMSISVEPLIKKHSVISTYYTRWKRSGLLFYRFFFSFTGRNAVVPSTSDMKRVSLIIISIL